MRTAPRLRVLLVLVVLTLLGFVLQIPWSPANHKIHVDGTVFAYGAQRMLEGDLLYEDIWDHKPPGVFLLNSLAFLLGPTDAWSLWILTVVWTTLISLVFFTATRQVLSTLAAAAFTVVLVATTLQPRFYQGANLTEFYGQLPAAATFLLVPGFVLRRGKWVLLALGTALAAAILIKPSSIGTPLAGMAVVLLVLASEERGSLLWRGMVLLMLPLAICVVGTGVIWGSQRALASFYQAVIEYNLAYVGGQPFIRSFYASLRELATDPTLSPLAVLAGAGAVRLIGSWVRRWNRGGSPTEFVRTISLPEAFALTALLAVLFETGFIALAGRGFGHYYMAIIPAITALAGGWISGKEDPSASQLGVAAAGLGVWLIAIFGLVRPSIDDLRSFVLDAPVRRPLVTDVGKFVVEVTEPGDSLLTWGLGAELNFETGRRSPTPFVYYLPLFAEGFHNERTWDRFLGNLRADPPVLIIAQREGGYGPDFDVAREDLDLACRCQGAILEGFAAFRDFVDSSYEHRLMFNEYFSIYVLKE